MVLEFRGCRQSAVELENAVVVANPPHCSDGGASKYLGNSLYR